MAALACFSVPPRPGDKHFPFILFLLINQNNHIAFTFRIESLLLLQVKLPQNSMYQMYEIQCKMYEIFFELQKIASTKQKHSIYVTF